MTKRKVQVVDGEPTPYYDKVETDRGTNYMDVPAEQWQPEYVAFCKAHRLTPGPAAFDAWMDSVPTAEELMVREKARRSREGGA